MSWVCPLGSIEAVRVCHRRVWDPPGDAGTRRARPERLGFVAQLPLVERQLVGGGVEADRAVVARRGEL